MNNERVALLFCKLYWHKYFEKISIFFLQITGREIPEVVESCVKFIKKFGE